MTTHADQEIEAYLKLSDEELNAIIALRHLVLSTGNATCVNNVNKANCFQAIVIAIYHKIAFNHLPPNLISQHAHHRVMIPESDRSSPPQDHLSPRPSLVIITNVVNTLQEVRFANSLCAISDRMSVNLLYLSIVIGAPFAKSPDVSKLVGDGSNTRKRIMKGRFMSACRMAPRFTHNTG